MDLIQFFSNLFFFQRPIQFYRIQSIVDLAELAPDVFIVGMLCFAWSVFCLLYVLVSIVGSIVKYNSSFFGRRQVQAESQSSMVIGQDDEVEDGVELGNEYDDQEGNASTFTLLASGSSNTLVGQDDSFKPDDDEASIPTLPEQHSADPVVTPVVIPVVAPAEPPPAYVADATTSNNGTVGNATATAADARPVNRGRYKLPELTWIMGEASLIVALPNVHTRPDLMDRLIARHSAQRREDNPDEPRFGVREAPGMWRKLRGYDDSKEKIAMPQSVRQFINDILDH